MFPPPSPSQVPGGARAPSISTVSSLPFFLAEFFPLQPSSSSRSLAICSRKWWLFARFPEYLPDCRSIFAQKRSLAQDIRLIPDLFALDPTWNDNGKAAAPEARSQHRKRTRIRSSESNDFLQWPRHAGRS